MTKKETYKILAVLKEAGVSFVNANENILVELWESCFKNVSYKDVSWAVYELINSPQPLFLNGLIGKIKEKIVLKKHNYMDFNTMWQLLQDAVANIYPDLPEENVKVFRKLPIEIQAFLGTTRDFVKLNDIKTDIFETVVKSNMRKSWEEFINISIEQEIAGQLPMWQAERLENSNQKKLDNMVAKLVAKSST
jgi:hypothetical protein